MPRQLTMDWLGHREANCPMVLNRLQEWLLYRLNGLDYRFAVRFNFFVLYGGAIASLIYMLRSVDVPATTVYLFALPLLTPIPSENHSWAFQACFHHLLIATLLACVFLFDEQQRASRLIVGVLLLVVALISFPAGIGVVAGVLALYVVFKLGRFSQVREDRQRETCQLVWVLAVVGTCACAWIISWAADKRLNPSSIVETSLLSVDLWAYFVNMISLGFGVDATSTLLGTICVSVLVLPVMVNLWRNRCRVTGGTYAVYAAMAAFLVADLTVAVGRASRGVASSKTSRYAEITLMLVPLCAAAWYFLLTGRKRQWVLGVLLILVLAAHTNDWPSGVQRYTDIHGRQMHGIYAIERFLAGEELDTRACYGMYNFTQRGYVTNPIPELLDRARLMGMSFYTSLENHNSKKINARN